MFVFLKVGSGYVPLGSFGGDQPIVSAVCHVVLSKISPNIQGLFFQGESFGVSPLERCIGCRLKISECRICSKESAILTAHEEEE